MLLIAETIRMCLWIIAIINTTIKCFQRLSKTIITAINAMNKTLWLVSKTVRHNAKQSKYSIVADVDAIGANYSLFAIKHNNKLKQFSYRMNCCLKTWQMFARIAAKVK